MRVVVATVGASLLSNYCRVVGVRQDDLLGDGGAAEKLARHLESLEGDSLLRACAETNTLERILREGDFIFFFHSETAEGKLCAEALKTFYGRRGYRVEAREVKGLRYDNRQFKVVGLHSLVNGLTEIVEAQRRSGREVVFVATGGFKAEMAYTTLVALLYGVEAYYIHESFDDVVSLPVIPLFFNPDVWLRHVEDVEWLVEEPRTGDELKEKFGEDLKYFWALLDEVERGKYGLSPAGWVVYGAYRRGVVKLSSIQLNARIRVGGGHRTVWGVSGETIGLDDIPDREARKLLRRLLSLPWVREVKLGGFSGKKPRETFLKLQNVEGNSVRFRLYSKGYGIQDLEAVTGSRDEAVQVEEFIGSKAYP